MSFASPLRSRLGIVSTIIAFVFAVYTGSAHAASPNQSARLGVGSTNIGLSGESPSLSLDWRMGQSSSAELDLGMNTQSSSNTFLIAIRYLKFLFLEQQQSYGVFMGAGLLTVAGTSSNASGYFLETGLMARFFFQEFPNLGFHLASGVRLESPESVRFRTTFFGGFHYYF